MEVLASMGDECESAAAITEDSYILGNLNWRSIEIIYLANALQQHYEQVFPFEDFFQSVEQREGNDVKLGEFVDFIYSNLAETAAEKHG
jgi:hypothetical protein